MDFTGTPGLRGGGLEQGRQDSQTDRGWRPVSGDSDEKVPREFRARAVPLCGGAGSWAELSITCSRGRWARRLAGNQRYQGWRQWGSRLSQANAEGQLKTRGHLQVLSAAPFGPNAEWLGLQKTSSAPAGHAHCLTMPFSTYKLMERLTPPETINKKETERENVEVPTYLLSDTRAHWPWHGYAGAQGSRRWQRGTVGERKRRVLAREEELMSRKLCTTTCVTDMLHAPEEGPDSEIRQQRNQSREIAGR